MAEVTEGSAFIATPENFTPKITVLGAGGGGCNVVTKMVDLNIQYVDFVSCNTDLKALNSSLAHTKIELGKNVTRGLGAGANPEVGAKATQESMSEIEDSIADSNMLFIAAGMGGGTGTGALPLIAKVAKEREILTVGVVTTPFTFEGRKRMRIAKEGIEHLRQHTDTLLVIPNDKLLDATTQSTSLLDAFHLADEVLINAIQGITDLINNVGEINVDFADVKTIMEGMGAAVIGKGTSTGEDRMVRAAQNAIESPLMRDTDIRGAKGILIHVVGSKDMTLFEINAAVSTIEELADEDVNLIFGATALDSQEHDVSVTIIATGIPD